MSIDNPPCDDNNTSFPLKKSSTSRKKSEILLKTLTSKFFLPLEKIVGRRYRSVDDTFLGFSANISKRRCNILPWISTVAFKSSICLLNSVWFWASFMLERSRQGVRGGGGGGGSVRGRLAE